MNDDLKFADKMRLRRGEPALPALVVLSTEWIESACDDLVSYDLLSRGAGDSSDREHAVRMVKSVLHNLLDWMEDDEGTYLVRQPALRWRMDGNRPCVHDPSLYRQDQLQVMVEWCGVHDRSVGLRLFNFGRGACDVVVDDYALGSVSMPSCGEAGSLHRVTTINTLCKELRRLGAISGRR